jgi:hypothetical protein
MISMMVWSRFISGGSTVCGYGFHLMAKTECRMPINDFLVEQRKMFFQRRSQLYVPLGMLALHPCTMLVMTDSEPCLIKTFVWEIKYVSVQLMRLVLGAIME